jgi:hypothetical protein
MSRPFVILSITLAAMGCSHAAPAPTPKAHAELVREGETLVKLGGCGDCHTPVHFDEKLGAPVPIPGRMLSGHPVGAPDPSGDPARGDQAVIGPTFTSFKLPFGVVYSANLTPDRESGLGKWSEAEFIATMRSGHHQGTGRPVLPPMPWQNLAQQPDENLRAVFAYLQSIPPVSNRVPAATVPDAVVASIDKSYAAAAKTAVQ